MKLFNEVSLKRLRTYIFCVACPLVLVSFAQYGLAVIMSPSARFQGEDWTNLAMLILQPLILALILWLGGEYLAYRKDRLK